MTTGGLIAHVRPGSPAARAGLRAGDRVVSVDGHPLRDLIDWRWHASDRSVEIGVSRDDEALTVALARDSGEWGVEFEAVVFDGVRTCDNACEFCFVNQLPAGLRTALYVKDDDYRLSFLAGNFITLTNLGTEDVERIIDQRLSPLHVSLHAVDAAVRSRLVGCRGEDRALETFDRLHAASIEFHVQIVVVPGVNDGAVLAGTLDWLEARPGVRSVGVVPLGYTAHQSRYAESFGGASAGTLLDAIHAVRDRRAGAGMSRWVHAADELYLTAGRSMPPGDDYEEYPQYENGIGLVRSFLDGWSEARTRPTSGALRRTLVLCTGAAFAPVLAGVASELDAAGGVAGVDVLAVENVFFGGGVSVTGLLTGVDLATSIREDARRSSDVSRTYLVPEIVFNDDGVTLDDMRAEDVIGASAADVRVVPHDPFGFHEWLLRSTTEE